MARGTVAQIQGPTLERRWKKKSSPPQEQAHNLASGQISASESRPDSVTLTAKPPSVPHQRAEQQSRSNMPASYCVLPLPLLRGTGWPQMPKRGAAILHTLQRDRKRAKGKMHVHPPHPPAPPGPSSPVISLRPGHRHPGPEQRRKLRLTIIKYASSGEICPPLPPLTRQHPGLQPGQIQPAPTRTTIS